MLYWFTCRPYGHIPVIYGLHACTVYMYNMWMYMLTKMYMYMYMLTKMYMYIHVHVNKNVHVQVHVNKNVHVHTWLLHVHEICAITCCWCMTIVKSVSNESFIIISSLVYVHMTLNDYCRIQERLNNFYHFFKELDEQQHL